MIKFIPFLLLYLGCMQTFNSNTGDEGLMGNCVSTSNTNLRQAYSIIRTNCTSCHTGYHNSWSTNCTDQAWIDSGTVVQGDPSNSDFITRLKNFTPPSDMPLSAPQISSDDYELLLTWIQNISI